jgi:hypothetical protein
MTKRYSETSLAESASMTVSAVTDTPIRYEQVFVCLGCDLLAMSPRADATTCSNACRVRVHRRRDELADWYASLKAMKVRVALVQQCQAISRLRPDLMPQIRDGAIEIHDTRKEIYLEFVKRLFAQVEWDSTTTADADGDAP